MSITQTATTLTFGKGGDAGGLIWAMPGTLIWGKKISRRQKSKDSKNSREKKGKIEEEQQMGKDMALGKRLVQEG